jgi:RNA polymerase sigma-70 factor, ECF subfamily
MSDAPDLDAWMARLAEGDRRALDPLYRGLWPRCRDLAVRILRDPVLGEDAAQQALIRLVEAAHRYDPGRSVVPWALTLVAWECRTVRRRQGRRRETDLAALHPLVDPARSPEDGAIHAALLDMARQAVATLSETDRETLALAFSDVPPDERPVPGATFRKRRQRALTRLRAAWRSLHDG